MRDTYSLVYSLVCSLVYFLVYFLVYSTSLLLVYSVGLCDDTWRLQIGAAKPLRSENFSADWNHRFLVRYFLILSTSVHTPIVLTVTDCFMISWSSYRLCRIRMTPPVLRVTSRAFSDSKHDAISCTVQKANSG